MYAELVKAFSSYQVYKQKVLNFHWNVTGPQFYEIHILLDRVYKELDAHIDRIAEHTRAYGRAPGLYSVYLKMSSIQENLSLPPGLDMLEELAKDLTLLESDWTAVNSAAADMPGTANLVGDILEMFKVLSYLLNSMKAGFNV